MKRKFILTIVGFSVVLLSFVGAPAYGRGGGHGGGGGYGGSQRRRTRGLSAAAATGAELVVATVEPGSPWVWRQLWREALLIRNLNGTLRRLRAQRYYAPRSSTGDQIYRFFCASSQGRTASKQFARSPKYSGSYYVPRDQSATGFARKSAIHPRDYAGTNRDIRQQRAGTTAKGATRPDNAWSRQNATNKQRLDPQTKERLRNWQGKAPG